jgi:peptidoglycan/xylan/chitin deacetylase (PgdA/CDA1 family)
LTLFRNIIKFIKKTDSFQIAIVALLLVFVLFQNSFSTTHILALSSSLKHIDSHDNHATKFEKPTGIKKTNNNNAITGLRPIDNNSKNSGLSSTVGSDNLTKVVILTFGDTWKSQFTAAKPILDQYGFKASFFITCRDANDQKHTNRMNWNDILALQEDGQDIESKGMTPVDLNSLSPAALDFEIGDSKQCLENHGINPPNIFAAKYGDVWNNPTVIDAISKYYGFADNGFANSMFLHCDGYGSSGGNKQADCRTYDDSSTLNYANRYSIREESHNSWDESYLHDDQIIFQKFIEEVNSGVNFNNKKGMVDAIPIVAYHNIDNTKEASSTDINLFAAEMKYLHDHGFKVIPMSDLVYDESTNFMYIKQ